MPHTRFTLFFALIAIFTCANCFAIDPGVTISRNAGFSLPDSVSEVTIRYRRANNLILLPVIINDKVRVNLILDTGCRNVVLFGRRFMKEFDMQPDKRVEFSGLGSGDAVSGRIALDNKVTIDAVQGERIPVIVVPNPNLFGSYIGVDGVIGYDVFIKFEVEINASEQLITFRPAQTANPHADYNLIPIRVDDSRPIVASTLSLAGNEQSLDVMIDTGSSLGLLLKSDNIRQYPTTGIVTVLGRGLNGPIEGMKLRADWLALENFQIRRVAAGVAYSEWSSTSSIGMEILGSYSFILNYCKGYAGFKRDQLPVAAISNRSQSASVPDF